MRCLMVDRRDCLSRLSAEFVDRYILVCVYVEFIYIHVYYMCTCIYPPAVSTYIYRAVGTLYCANVKLQTCPLFGSVDRTSFRTKGNVHCPRFWSDQIVAQGVYIYSTHYFSSSHRLGRGGMR